jgi:tetratricopeptide (TPR) repeat protein
MNSIFRSYPAHPWLSEWIFEPRGCGTSFREKTAGHFFHTLETVGRICPNLESPEWSLQIPIPQNSRINMMFNGFCGYFEQKKRRFSAEAIVPEPGVLWGRFFNIPAPVLLSDETITETDGFHWLESDTAPALLAIRDEAFCLVTKAHIFADAVQLAETYLGKDLEANMSDELERRAGAIKLFEQMNHHDALTVISVECMMRALRPAEGNIPGLWSQSPAVETPHFDTNNLYALALAWRHIDIDTAENLIRTTLKLQTSSGAIPITYSPRETFSVLEAPKPLIAKTAEKVWLVRKDPQFIDDIIQPLRRHVQWLLHHFDPKRRGLHCWQSSGEPLTPEIYETDLATVDLSVLLLTEIEALERLRKAAPAYADQPPFFTKECDSLEHNLQTQFWNEDDAQFSNAIIRGRMTKVKGFPAFVPLLWKKLPLRLQSLIIDRIRESGNLPGGVSLLSWRKSALDDQSFPLIQQLLVLEILKEADPHGTLISGFARLIMQGFVEWHTLSIEEYGTLQIDSVTAAYIINLQETQHHRYQAKGRLSALAFKLFRKSRADWFDIAVVLASILAVASVHSIYDQLRKPPPLITLEAQMNSAYASKDAQGTLKAGRAILKYYPDQSVMAKLMTGNILLIQHQYEEASTLLVDVRQAYPDSPGPMIALGLAYQLQGRFDEAEANYAEFTYLFDEIFPEITDIIRKNRYLMEEGFRSPPKWTEIYRYQLMHEL